MIGYFPYIFNSLRTGGWEFLASLGLTAAATVLISSGGLIALFLLRRKLVRSMGQFNTLMRELVKTVNEMCIRDREYGLGGSSGAYQSVEVQADGEVLELSADVTYLNNYTDHVDLSFKVCTLEMTVDAQSSVPLKEIADGSGSMTVTATRNGEPLTEEQWNSASVEIAAKDEEGEEFPLEWDVQQGSDCLLYTSRCV